MKMPMMNWEALLSLHMLGANRLAEHSADGRSAFHRDLDRIVFSSAFRRLQDKTQVHPISGNDHVRTRLTHSVEVASVGRSLGMMVGQFLCNQKGLKELVQPGHISSIVQAACLAHDIGNPPFGHLGEEAIQHYFKNFKTHGSEAVVSQLPGDDLVDLSSFDGNPQGFRILANIEMCGKDGGLQLTHATLGAFTKYPNGSGAPAIEGHTSTKKTGFFRSEAHRFAEVAKTTGLLLRDGRDDSWCRHPLAYLMEAADDICYTVIDLEDGVELGLVASDAANSLLDNIIGARQYRGLEHRRAIAIGTLTEQCCTAFQDKYDLIMMGQFQQSLIDVIPKAQEVAEIRKINKAQIYKSRGVFEREVVGFDIITGLLEEFLAALLKREEFRNPKEERIARLINFSPASDESTYETIRKVVDYVSGMTDRFALDLFRRIKGIEF